MLDTRDLLEQIEALEQASETEPGLSEDDWEYLTELRMLIDALLGYSEDSPEDGIALIRDDEFEDYARDLADDIGAINQNAGWPLSYIDWETAADALKEDYTEIEFQGRTYWFR